MPVSVKIAGDWFPVNTMHVKSGGTWHAVTQAFVRSGGTWSPLFVAGSVSLNNLVLLAANDYLGGVWAQAGYRVNNLDIQTLSANSGSGGSYSSVHTWLSGGSASAYEFRLSYTGDAPTSGSATGTWIAATSNPQWDWYAAFPSALSASVTVEVRLAASPYTVLASDSFVVDVATSL